MNFKYLLNMCRSFACYLLLCLLTSSLDGAPTSHLYTITQRDMCDLMDSAVDVDLQLRFLSSRFRLPSSAITDVLLSEPEDYWSGDVEDQTQLYQQVCPYTPVQSCSPELCGIRISQYLSNARCNCDTECEKYGDCCYNYWDTCGPSSTLSSGEVPDLLPSYDSSWSCQPKYGERTRGYLMISSCSETEDTLCTSTTDEFADNSLGQLLLSIPAHHQPSNVVFKNIMCASCNNVSSSEIDMWNVFILCPNTVPEPEVEESRDNVELLCSTLNNSECQVIVEPSPSTTTLYEARKCRPYAISDCPPTLTNATWLSNACTSYTNYVFTSGLLFRNAHCALCNGASLSAHRPYTFTFDWQNELNKIKNSTSSYHIPENAPLHHWHHTAQITPTLLHDIQNSALSCSNV